MDKPTQNITDTLLFRRQFILGPRFLDRFSNWQNIPVGGRFFAHVHPDLELTQVQTPEVELTLIGYIIDPHHPELNNQQILEVILPHIKSPQNIFEHTYRMGGRYVLIVNKGPDTILFSDAVGLRQVHYTNQYGAESWCASEASNIASQINLDIDEEIANSFALQMKGKDEYWWPGNSTPYRQISRLLPNHYLDLNHRTSHRYWPSTAVAPIPFEEGAAKIAELLKQFINGAAARFPLALPITAGFDSRTILAATRDVSQNTFYYTFFRKNLAGSSPDITIPARLLAKLGITHHLLELRSKTDSGFRELFERSVTPTHDSVYFIAQILANEYPPNRVMLSSHASEIGRCLYHKFAEPPALTAEFLADKVDMRNEFTYRHLGLWLDEAKKSATQYGFNVLDFFYWEQRIGSWGANGSQQLDIIHDRFDPFNCHEVATLMLAVNIRYRRPPYALHKKIMSILWPEVLSEPINPAPITDRLKIGLKILLARTNTYAIIRDLKSSLQSL